MMGETTRRPRTSSAESAPLLAARILELSRRIDRLSREMEGLTELVKGQNDLLRRQHATTSGAGGGVTVPPARLAAEADPAGPGDTSGYADLVIRIRALVRSVVPAGATVLVASKGDEELLLLEGRRGWHFPQMSGGLYSGHHPADSDEAIDGLESLRSLGAEFFVLPSTAFWWLDYYPGFAAHLTGRHRVALRNQEACLIFDLRDRQQEGG